MACGTWEASSFTLVWRSRCGPLLALPLRDNAERKFSSKAFSIFWSLTKHYLLLELIPKCFLGFFAEALQTSCGRSLRMQGCPYKASHVSANTLREQIMWSPCSVTWKTPTLAYNSSSSYCLGKLLSTVTIYGQMQALFNVLFIWSSTS